MYCLKRTVYGERVGQLWCGTRSLSEPPSAVNDGDGQATREIGRHQQGSLRSLRSRSVVRRLPRALQRNDRFASKSNALGASAGRVHPPLCGSVDAERRRGRKRGTGEAAARRCTRFGGVVSVVWLRQATIFAAPDRMQTSLSLRRSEAIRGRQAPSSRKERHTQHLALAYRPLSTS